MINDNELNNLEKFIPKLADGAFQKAYLDTLSHGGSVLIAEDGKLVYAEPGHPEYRTYNTNDFLIVAMDKNNH